MFSFCCFSKAYEFRLADKQARSAAKRSQKKTNLKKIQPNIKKTGRYRNPGAADPITDQKFILMRDFTTSDWKVFYNKHF